jgi:hypothetical protein
MVKVKRYVITFPSYNAYFAKINNVFTVNPNMLFHVLSFICVKVKSILPTLSGKPDVLKEYFHLIKSRHVYIRDLIRVLTKPTLNKLPFHVMKVNVVTINSYHHKLLTIGMKQERTLL